MAQQEGSVAVSPPRAVVAPDRVAGTGLESGLAPARLCGSGLVGMTQVLHHAVHLSGSGVVGLLGGCGLLLAGGTVTGPQLR